MKQFTPFLLAACLMLISQAGFAQSKVFTNADNIALGGYDVVAYHKANAAVRGSNEHTATANGATYYFSSADNQKAFQASPAKYLPEYGGYCAFAMAMKGAKVPSDPKTFKLHDGKLYLFFNDYYEGKPFNTIIPWNSDEKNMIAKADANWGKG